MKVTKENILDYLYEIQPQFKKDGIVSFALFGSYAKDTQTVYSDIDIAFKKNKEFHSVDISSHYLA